MKTSLFIRISMLKSIVLVISQLVMLIEVQAQDFDASISFSAPDSGYVQPVLHLILSDSTGYTHIDVQVYDVLNDSLYFSYTFLFDQVTGLPAGISWARTGSEVTLGLGDFPENGIWKGKIRSKDLSGSWSAWYELLFN